MLRDNKAFFDGVQQDGATQRTRYYERALLLVKRAVLLLIMVPFLLRTNGSDMISMRFDDAVDSCQFSVTHILQLLDGVPHQR